MLFGSPDVGCRWARFVWKVLGGDPAFVADPGEVAGHGVDERGIDRVARLVLRVHGAAYVSRRVCLDRSQNTLPDNPPVRA